MKRWLGAASLLGWVCCFPGVAAGQAYDVVIRGGRVLDGSGNPWFSADVGIRDGTIAAVGRLSDPSADRVVDAVGKYVVPGFIDLHSHADGHDGLESGDRRRRVAPNLVTQGITTVVVNQDGRSPWPIADQRAALAEMGIGVNALLLVGHGTIRRMVLSGDVRRRATVDEIDRLRRLTRQAMEQGAYGLSSGLEYVPGRWSDTDEVAAIVAELAPYGGVYVTHERSSGADPMWYLPSQDPPGQPSFLDAVVETIEIAERTGVTAVQTHVKARGANYWGSSHAAIQLIQRARHRGVPIWADHYPYNTTGSDGNTVLLPDWALGSDRWGAGEGDGANVTPAESLRRVLADPDAERNLRRDITHEIARRGSAENIVVMRFPDTPFVGKSIAELARRFGTSAVDVAIQLQLDGDPARPGGAELRGFSLSEYDVESYARQPWVATATDGWITLPEDGLTHSRVYGTFPRKIRRYAMERGVLSVEDAVRSGTSLPAQILRLEDRGMVRAGMRADLAVLDLERLRDRSTFFDPHQYAEGVEYVLVNGAFVVDEGRVTGTLPGVVITPRRASDHHTGEP